MNNLIKQLFYTLIVVVIIDSTAYAISPFLQNKGIVDIGRKTSSSEIEVPLDYIYNEPSLTSVPNTITYNNRLQSELFQCENDFLGTETCPNGREECTGFEEFEDGYSTKHHVVKSFIKLCPLKTISVDDKCYYDANEDGVVDTIYIHKTDTIKVWENVWLAGLYYDSGGCEMWDDGCSGSFKQYPQSHSVTGTITVGKYGILKVRQYSPQACDDDTNTHITKLNDITVLDVGCNSTRDFTKTAYSNMTDNEVTLDYFMSTTHHGGGWDHYGDAYLYKYELEKVPPENFSWEYPTTSSIIFYRNAKCPANSVEQLDGSCKMEYDWYSYHCPVDTNYYQYPWSIRDSGKDCGNPTCTNSENAPLLNCVRQDYACPNNPDTKCGKSVIDEIDCGDGYVRNDNRCERLESFCGSSSYNAAKDICENITHYTKLCASSSDIYSIELDKCVSSIEICKDGTYSIETKTCIMDFIGKCTMPGYSYDTNSQSCIDNTIEICTQSGYLYDVQKKECLATMTMCETGKNYNNITNKCEDELCGNLDTTNNNSRCETSSQCVGTVTSSGKCIPNVVQ